MAHSCGRRVPVVVDVERYRERRRETLEEMAWRFAERVRRTGRPVALRPMSSAERRIIHTTLAQDSGIATHSEGEDPEPRGLLDWLTRRPLQPYGHLFHTGPITLT